MVSEMAGLMGVTFTTINDSLPMVSALVDNFVTHGRTSDAFIVIIGDAKTPSQERALRYAEGRGVSCHYMDLGRQEDFLEPFSMVASAIPVNSDNRRNVGYLKAAQLGADIIVSTDDDNFPILEEDFYGRHQEAIGRRWVSMATSTTGWVNPYDFLRFNVMDPVYARGFPLSKRDGHSLTIDQQEAVIGLNMGLLLGDPDVNSFTHLDRRIQIIGTKEFKSAIAVGKGTMTTINSQNTCLHRGLLPSYYYVRMTHEMDRYGDIWQGFFAKKCADAVGECVSFGGPLVLHKRNSHNYLADMRKELQGIIINERLVEFLAQLDLKAKSYADAYTQLADELPTCPWGDSRIQEYWTEVAKTMRFWVDACEKLL